MGYRNAKATLIGSTIEILLLKLLKNNFNRKFLSINYVQCILLILKYTSKTDNVLLPFNKCLLFVRHHAEFFRILILNPEGETTEAPRG